MFTSSRDWTNLLLLRKTLSAFHFQLNPFLKQYVLHCTRNWADRCKRSQGVGSFFDGKVWGYWFRSPKKPKPTNQAVWCKRILNGIVWNSGRLDYSELPNFVPSDVKGEYFAKRTEKYKILGCFLAKDVDNLANHGCPKVQDLLDEQMLICSRDPFRQKITLHCANCTAERLGNWIMQHLKL